MQHGERAALAAGKTDVGAIARQRRRSCQRCMPSGATHRVPPCRRSSPARRRSGSASSRTTPRSRRWSSAPGSARVERFDDSTDMCSLVNAKSGGCAEDCGFCAQSRFAEAETPMHAMMEPEQILEHAKRGRGRRRAPLLHGHPGPGALQARLRGDPRGRAAGRRADEPQALRLDRAHERQARAGSSRTRASSACTTTSRPRARTTPRSPRPSATRAGCARSRRSREAGLETCVGGILNLGESREQRVEMAFELAAIDPTSVPINLLNPRPGTKFGDRDYMDPWEAVKWIAIFRLILPEALFRLCGGRMENLGELQRLAVRAGINGVMIGNFLTTLGNTPEEDHAMFEEQGLNIARQPDNGANPRPDNRSGWLEGETPDVVAEHIAAEAPALDVTPLGPLRAAALPQEVLRAAATRRRAQRGARPLGRVDRSLMLDLQDRLDELKGLGLYRRMRMVSGPQGPRVVLDGKPVLLLCSNNYLGLADHPRVREAAADAAMRWGVGAGASRLVSGNMTLHRRLEERLAAFKGTQSALLFGSGYLANLGVVPRARAARARSSSPTSSTTPRSSTAAGSSGAETFVYRHGDVEHLGMGPAQRRRPRRADRHRRRLLDGRRRRAARGDRRARAAPRRARDGRRRARDRHARAGRPRRGRRGRPRGRGRRDRRHARQGARLLRRVRRLRPRDGALPRQHARAR